MRTSKPSLTPKQINSPKISIKTLQKALETEAKKANTRLRALEKAGMTKSSHAYKAIRDYAEDNRQFVKSDKTGNIRFNRSIKNRTKEDLVEELNQLYTFNYRAKTSTVSGVKKTDEFIKQQTQNQNTTGTKSEKVREFFSKMTMSQFKDFWEQANLERLYDMRGSDQTVRIIDKMKENKYIGDDWELMNKVAGDLLTKMESQVKAGLIDSEWSEETFINEIAKYKPVGVIE